MWLDTANFDYLAHVPRNNSSEIRMHRTCLIHRLFEHATMTHALTGLHQTRPTRAAALCQSSGLGSRSISWSRPTNRRERGAGGHPAPGTPEAEIPAADVRGAPGPCRALTSAAGRRCGRRTRPASSPAHAARPAPGSRALFARLRARKPRAETARRARTRGRRRTCLSVPVRGGARTSRGAGAGTGCGNSCAAPPRSKPSRAGFRCGVLFGMRPQKVSLPNAYEHWWADVEQNQYRPTSSTPCTES